VTDGPTAPKSPLTSLRRFVTERRALSGGIAAAVVVVLVVVLVLTVGGGGGSPSPTPTRTLPTPSASTSPGGSTTVSGKPAVPDSGAYLGVYAAPHTGLGLRQPSNGGREDITGTAIDKLEAQTGTKFAIDHRYFNWPDPFSVELMRNTAADGRIPFLAFQTVNKSGPKITYADIAAGHYDASLDARADAAKAFGKPMFVSFDHEPNARIGKNGTAAEYVAAWRHIVDVFRQRGATNVSFVYVQTAASFRSGSPLDEALYPGDDYIDWVAADGYNFFGCEGKAAGWTPFKQIFNAFYTWGKAKNKPMMIAELGVSEDPSNPGRKAEWYRQAGQQLQDFPGIKAVVYYNGAPICPNWVDSSSESLAGFQDFAKQSLFIHQTTG
jgi:hypothetical protein